MIKNVTSYSPWLNVSSYVGATPYITNGIQAPAVGQIWWNSSRSRIEVYDGSQWHEMCNGHATVDLSPPAQDVMQWAQRKMQEEQELQRRMERHPGLRDAYERFQIMDVLTREEEKEQQVG
jgi:hypothetical protein